LGVLGGICILGGAEAKGQPVASSISTGMTEERDGLISGRRAGTFWCAKEGSGLIHLNCDHVDTDQG